MFEDKWINHIAAPSEDCCGFLFCHRCFGWESKCCEMVCDIEWFEKMETDWHKVPTRNHAHKKRGCLHGNLEKVQVSPEFLGGKTRSQAEKMRVDPARVSLFFQVNDSCFKKRWLCVAAEDLHNANGDGKDLDDNKSFGENMFPDIKSEDDMKAASEKKEEEEEEVVQGESGKMQQVQKKGELVSGEWKIGNPMEVRFVKTKKRGSMECEMHFTLNKQMTIGKNPRKRMKTHCNNGDSKQTLAVAIADGARHCVLSDETTVDGDDNTKTRSIQAGKQNSENNDKKPPAKTSEMNCKNLKRKRWTRSSNKGCGQSG